MEAFRDAVLDKLRVHPRLAQQGIAETPAQRERLLDALPKVVPFGGRRPLLVVALLDWDHRLPSRSLYVRVHLFYSERAVEQFEEAFGERTDEIQRRGLFPEFDVPDWEELPGEESYEAELQPDFTVQTMRLTSPWRRDVDPEIASEAVELVRDSDAFRRVREAEPGRAPHLGDLEPVSWMPPCESGHEGWTVDVWWLTAFDGRIGRGWSFLVDIESEAPIVAHREFSVRAG